MASSPYHNILRGILALFGRHELFTLSLVCRRFLKMVDNQFPYAPYFVCNSIASYDRGESNTWLSPHIGPPVFLQTDAADRLSKLKFLRFSKCVIGTASLARTLQILPEISHFWEGRSLVCQCHHFAPNAEMVLQISRASTLSLTCHFDQMGVLLREILAGNFNELSITEASSSQAEPLEMPVEDVVDFFFRQSSVQGNRFQKNRKLYIRSLTNPTVKARDDLFNAIKERFLNATAPHYLWFWWNPTHVGEIVDEIANPETDQSLRLTASTRQYSMQRGTVCGFSFLTMDAKYSNYG
ncbi:hypothetical protein DdX_05271 [Ditylenchus destructor]|uniref:F-box domain-containing protein n=1 Tax=Ditylenchus destructor TaxID=166010 RepID=A0AAD4RAJ1_9BILA|nr:hypothetical protein DdX_05271 [Ditylenchus destructor]